MNKIDELINIITEALDLFEDLMYNYNEPTEKSEELEATLENMEEVQGHLQVAKRILRREISDEFYNSFTSN